jgi:hypothetical protein
VEGQLYVLRYMMPFKGAFFYPNLNRTRPARAGFKTAEEGRAKMCKFLCAKVEE